ncbi:MAG: S8 family serine peptidase [Verrucomicrobia bacterium]|nr:S8 family serine peptidase [Verrucomicrobiota bacterium]
MPDADIDAPEAWDLQSRAPNVVVALIDSGIWRTHEDLAANLWVNPGETPGNNLDDDGNGYVDDVYGVNVTTGTGAIGDSAGHGTHLAGILGAVTDNGKGVAGVAWQVQIMTCRFLDSAGQGAISDAVACIDYARLMGAHVINASWVTTEPSTALELAVASAREAGMVFVAGAGNDGQDNDRAPFYPPNLPLDNVIAVAATDAQDRLWSRSNFGAANVDLAAPGVNIHSTFFIADNNYAAMTGSSQAAAFVSGAAALVRAAYPAATPRR